MQLDVGSFRVLAMRTGFVNGFAGTYPVAVNGAGVYITDSSLGPSLSPHVQKRNNIYYNPLREILYPDQFDIRRNIGHIKPTG